MLIVSKTDSCRADFHYELDVLFVMLGKKGITKAPSILMARYAAEGIFLSVEDKAVFGIDLEGTATEARAYVVKYSLALNYLCLTAVEVRIAATVPEMNVLDLKYNLLIGRFDLLKLVFFLVIKGVNYLLTLCKLGGENFNLNLCVSTINCGSDHYTGCSVVIKVKVRLVHCDKVYVSVKTAVEGKVCHLRINLLVGRVVNDNRDLGSVGDLLGDIYSPSRVTAVVMSELFAVNVNVSRRICAAEFEIVKVALGESGLLKSLFIKARAAEVIVAAVIAVLVVPGVGKGNRSTLGELYVGGILDEKPVFIKI